MSARQFAEWQAYYLLEPFGPPAAFWRSGQTASMLVNVNRTKKSQEVKKPEDFMPRSMVKDDEPDRDVLAERVTQTFQELAEMKRHGE